MIGDFQRYVEWLRTIPNAMAEVARFLGSAVKALDQDQAKRWSALLPRLQGVVGSLYQELALDPRFKQEFENNLAACILTFGATWTDDELLECAVGILRFTPENYLELENNRRDGDRWRQTFQAMKDGVWTYGFGK